MRLIRALPEGTNHHHFVRAAKFSLFSVVQIVFAFGVLAAASQLAIAQSAPQVTKVEPPGWWANHSINPVRVLIRGRNLNGANISAGAGLVAGGAKVNASGTYAFVDMRVAPPAR